nr:hypothetical protein GCM10025732_50740 [Glycomyces mayteni]
MALVPKPFDAPGAAAGLERLAAWRDATDALIADPGVHALLGPVFTGLDTRLDLHRELVGYLKDIDSRFGGIQYRNLRRLMLEGDTDLLTTLARIDIADYRVTVDDLPNAVAARRSALAEMDGLLPVLASCATVLKHPATTTPERATELSESVDAMLAHLASIDADPLRDLLGARLRGPDTDTASFRGELTALDLCETEPALSRVFAELLAARTLDDTAERLTAYADAAESGRDVIADLHRATGADSGWVAATQDCELRAVHAAELAADRAGLQSHSMVHHRTVRLSELGFGAVASWLRLHAVAHPHALVLAHLYRGLATDVFTAHGELLRAFLGTELDDLRDRLAQADNLLQSTAAAQLAAKLYQGARPPVGVNRGRKSDYTEMGLLAHVKDLQRNRHSVRDVTRRAAQALLELKPCWMMSPLAVSQYLSRDTRFDLCIIDEASQMLPGAALGAVLRSKQVMIVGDNNQLPPSDLFSSTAASTDDDDEDFTEEAESVLEMAGRALPRSRRLRWHYRSRNSSLIAFSNRIIYDDQLVVFPSAWEDRDGMGVRLEHLADGLYEKSLNHVEAEAIVDAVARFARTDAHRSLGVVAMNVQQRNLINDLLHERAVADDALRSYQLRWEVEGDGIDSLFVKNLENVQGDERDVIFISTVYGPKEPGGPVHQHFGPVNGKAGRRRLNVLFTRAREQLVTFTSMLPGDISADEHGNPGRYMLRRWLEYCTNGGVHGEATGHEKPGARLAEHIGARLIERGYTVDYEVGTTGHRVDLAIRHPDWPHGYLCGIDCDGEEYYSSRSARDRDILRQQVLQGLGWKLYRAWSVNWYNDEEAELNRLLAWIRSVTDRGRG